MQRYILPINCNTFIRIFYTENSCFLIIINAFDIYQIYTCITIDAMKKIGSHI